MAGLDRHVRGAGLEDGQDRYEQLGGSVQQHGDARLGTGASGRQQAGESVGGGVELREAQRSACAADGDPFGTRPHLLLEELVHAPLRSRPSRAARPGEHAAARVGVHQAQPFERRRGTFDGVAQQCVELVGDREDGGLVETLRVVFEAGGHRLPGDDARQPQAERLGVGDGMDDPRARAAELKRLGPLPAVPAEARAVTVLRPGVVAGEELLVALPVGHGGGERFGEDRQRPRRRHLGADGHVVGVRADGVDELLEQAAVDRDVDRRAPSARTPRREPLPRGKQDVRQPEPMPGGQRSGSRDQGIVDDPLNGEMGSGAGSPAAPAVAGRVEAGSGLVAPLPPPLPALLGLQRSEHVVTPLRVLQVVKGLRRGLGRLGAVRTGDQLDEQRDRPGVGAQRRGRHDEPVIAGAGAGAGEGDPDGWPAGEIAGRVCQLGAARVADARGGLAIVVERDARERGGMRRGIDHLDRQVHRGQRAEGRPQRPLPRQHVRDRPFEPVRVQRPGDLQDALRPGGVAGARQIPGPPLLWREAVTLDRPGTRRGAVVGRHLRPPDPCVARPSPRAPCAGRHTARARGPRACCRAAGRPPAATRR